MYRAVGVGEEPCAVGKICERDDFSDGEIGGAVGHRLVDGEVVEFSVSAVASGAVVGEERVAVALERLQLVAEEHGVAYRGKLLAVGAE